MKHHQARDDDLESVTIGRTIFEYLVIQYCSLLSLEVPVWCFIGLWFYGGTGLWNDNFEQKMGVFIALSPFVGILVVSWMMLSAIVMKRLLVGDFSKFIKECEYLPETHIKVFRWRLTYLLVYESKKFLLLTDNYELTRVFWRLMGVKVGERVMIHPEAYLYETDLLHLGDGTHVEEMATLFCHTFRTRHLELKPIKVGAGAHIGVNSVVLPACVIGDNVELLPLTQIFPTERITSGLWHGNPAEPIRLGDSSI